MEEAVGWIKFAATANVQNGQRATVKTHFGHGSFLMAIQPRRSFVYLPTDKSLQVKFNRRC